MLQNPRGKIRLYMLADHKRADLETAWRFSADDIAEGALGHTCENKLGELTMQVIKALMDATHDPRFSGACRHVELRLESDHAAQEGHLTDTAEHSTREGEELFSRACQRLIGSTVEKFLLQCMQNA